MGGTTLTLNKNGTYGSETAWSGSGGGASQYQSEASYEKGVQTTGKQMDPDVAYDANPNTGFAVYDSVAYDGYSGWLEVGGTSAGAPQWSALVAIANQGRVLDHENTLTNAAAAVFAISSSDFHDITSGSDGGHSATKGYDEVTGLGTPQANLVAQGLLGVTAAQQTYTSIAASGSVGCVEQRHQQSRSRRVRRFLVVARRWASCLPRPRRTLPASSTGPAASLVGSTAGGLSAGGRLATPQGLGSTIAAATVFCVRRAATCRPRRTIPMSFDSTARTSTHRQRAGLGGRSCREQFSADRGRCGSLHERRIGHASRRLVRRRYRVGKRAVDRWPADGKCGAFARRLCQRSRPRGRRCRSGTAQRRAAGRRRRADHRAVGRCPSEPPAADRESAPRRETAG